MANGARTTYVYDAAGRLAGLTNAKSDNTVLSGFEYVLDAVGNPTGVTEGNGDVVTWTHDDEDRLVREQRSGDNAYDVSYTHDPVGNRLTKEEATP